MPAASRSETLNEKSLPLAEESEASAATCFVTRRLPAPTRVDVRFVVTSGASPGRTEASFASVEPVAAGSTRTLIETVPSSPGCLPASFHVTVRVEAS